MLYCRVVSAPGLDAEKLDVLRRWGGGLQGDGREEVAAAGRAILLLIEEIERLHVVLWDRKLYPDAPVEAPVALPPQAEALAAPEGDDENVPETLSERLRRGPRDWFSTA
jgi:hypothetical protein